MKNVGLFLITAITIVAIILLGILANSLSALAQDGAFTMVYSAEHYPVVKAMTCPLNSGVQILTADIKSAHPDYEGIGKLSLLYKESEFDTEKSMLLDEEIIVGVQITKKYTISQYYSSVVALDVVWNDGWEPTRNISGIAWQSECEPDTKTPTPTSAATSTITPTSTIATPTKTSTPTPEATLCPVESCNPKDLDEEEEPNPVGSGPRIANYYMYLPNVSKN